MTEIDPDRIDPDRWLSERETAALLGVGVDTVRRYRPCLVAPGGAAGAVPAG